MSESTRFFDNTSKLHETIRQITTKLDELKISYVVIGGMALTAHGYARMTDDIDILIERADLKRLYEEVVGRGYRRAFEGSKNLRDTNTGVKIEFVLTGDFPGSRKAQPIAFPSPADTDPVEHGGVKFLGLVGLVELKLASGMTGGADRARDLVDVQQLIETRDLQRPFATRLHEYVRPKYEELWDALRATEKRFVRLWRNKFLTSDATSLDEVIAILAGAVEELRQMQADGVVLDPDGGTGDDYARLVTSDPRIARKYDMHDESEFFDREDE